MPEISLLTERLRQQQEHAFCPDSSSSKKSRQPFSSTCFDFHMFFPALSHFLFLLLCRPPGAPAFHYRSQHFSAYTSDRVRVPAGGSRGQRAADIMPPCKTTASRSDWLPPATSYYQRLHAALLCQVAGHVTHSEANTHEHTLPSSLTLMQSQSSSCAVHILL